MGVPDKKRIASICGKCHADVEYMNAFGIRTDQLARYKTSTHGKKLFIDGDNRVAVCSDCHNYHDVLKVNDPNSPAYPLNAPKTCNRCHGNAKIMSNYKLPSDIFDKYSKSVHGIALFEKKDTSVANCISCHGSHGAIPPGVKDLGATCGKCHVNERKNFEESVHAKAHREGRFSECISCHGNHEIERPTPQLYEKACVTCHDVNSSAYQLGQQLQGLIYSAQKGLEVAQKTVKKASIEGIFVEPEEALLEEARSDVVSMAPLQHTLSLEKISELHKKSSDTFNKISDDISNKRKNLLYRKVALIPIWIFIVVMSLALWTSYNRLKNDQKKMRDE